MKGFLSRWLDLLAQRTGKQVLVELRGYDGYNLLEAAKLRAAFDSAEYYETYLLHAKDFATDLQLLSYAASLAPLEGLALEFGVASGRTINHLAGELSERTIFGFDSFDGLPEAWRPGFDRGQFAQSPPSTPENVQLVRGLFAQTLPNFLADHSDPVAFLHVDCDLYSSTSTIFSLLSERIVAGTTIVFDEYWNYPGWRQHEHKAFREFIECSSRSYDYKGFVSNHQQVCVVIK